MAHKVYKNKNSVEINPSFYLVRMNKKGRIQVNVKIFQAAKADIFGLIGIGSRPVLLFSLIDKD